jgi:hypothetical protein
MKRWVARRALGTEAAAERELDTVPDWLWNRETLPVPLETIADSHYGLLVRDEIELAALAGLDGDVHISGLLFPATREILVDAEEALRWPGRRRFTIGHELGHWVLHCELGHAGAEPVHCRTDSLSEQAVVDDDGEEPKPEAARRFPPPHERDANRFAAALLMPRFLVETEYAWLDGDERRLAEAFGVSLAAIQWRIRFLHELAELDD